MNGEATDDFWYNPAYESSTAGSACYGREGCRQAYLYVLHGGRDVAKAKEIAATYCVYHASQCADEAKEVARGRVIEGITSELLLAYLGGAAGAESKAAGACRNSFDPRTEVLMADGTTKPIVAVKIGDKVIAADPKTGKRGPHTVTAELLHRDNDLVDLEVRGLDGKAIRIHTTSHHPFWDDTAHSWVEAGRLTPGHTLKGVDNSHVTLTAVLPRPGVADMYNLTIADLHTYYVLAGRTPVLVHNCSISMDEAVSRAVAHVGDNATVVRSGSGGVQFMSVSTDASGNMVRKIARFDVNPESSHVQKLGPHLNLETRINGKTVTSGPLKDPHTAIDPSTIRSGDYWP